MLWGTFLMLEQKIAFPDSKLKRTRYKSVNYGISNYWSTLGLCGSIVANPMISDFTVWSQVMGWITNCWVNDLCCIFGFAIVGAKGKEDLQPMKGTSLTDISDSGNTNCTVAIWLACLSTVHEKLSLYSVFAVILSVGKSNIVAIQ